MAFCKNRPVNFGSIKQYHRVQITWTGDFSSVADGEVGGLLEEKTPGNATYLWREPPSSGLWALDLHPLLPCPNSSRGTKGSASDSHPTSASLQLPHTNGERMERSVRPPHEALLR